MENGVCLIFLVERVASTTIVSNPIACPSGSSNFWAKEGGIKSTKILKKRDMKNNLKMRILF
jgi:hypothetical protein